EYEYDERGNRTLLRNPLGEETRMRYDVRGQLVEEVMADGAAVQSVFDSAGNVVEQRDAAGTVWKAGYDNLRRLVTLNGPDGVERRFEWDSGGRLTKVTDGARGTTLRSYDAAGRLLKVSGVDAPEAEYAYDAAGRLQSVKDGLGHVTRYEYLPGGRLAAMVDAGGGRTRYEYDAAGRMTSEILPDGKARKWTYSARGEMLSKTLDDGRVVRMQYDAARRLVKVLGADGEEETFQYDERGNLLVAANETVTLYYAYDAMNRVVSVTDSRGPFTVSYGYDAGGRRKTLTDTNGRVTSFSYDTAGRLVGLVNGAGRAYGIEYGANRQRSRVIYPGGVAAVHGYDAAGRRIRIAYGTRAVYEAEYDAAGNPKWLSGPEGWHRYEYDALNRIVAAAHPTLPAEGFHYDAAGRRTDLPESPLRKEYDGLGRLKAVVAANGERVEYRYDPSGRMTERVADGSVVRHIYDGERILESIDGQGTVLVCRTYAGDGGELLEEERPDGAYLMLLDLRGNVGAVARIGDGQAPAGRKNSRAADEPAAEPEVVQVDEYMVYGEVSESGASEGAVLGGALAFSGFQQSFRDSVSNLLTLGGQVFQPLTGVFERLNSMSLGGLISSGGVSPGPVGQLVGGLAGSAMGSPSSLGVAGMFGGSNPLAQQMHSGGLSFLSPVSGMLSGPLNQAFGLFLSQVGNPGASGLTQMLTATLGGGLPVVGVVGQTGTGGGNAMGNVDPLGLSGMGAGATEGLMPGISGCAVGEPGFLGQMMQVLGGTLENAQSGLQQSQSSDELLNLQDQMMRAGRTYQMLSNILQSQHEAMMGVIRNLRN
ncbi:MAG: RHS repeat protein, partial [Acidobacteria bacterium]|nr:RHS repeat protein [Acidobacteriota bacterium]